MKKSKPQNLKSERGGRDAANEDFLIVGIGASAGGVQALKTFFENVPANSNAAYVVILHLSPDHDSQLAAILQTVSAIPVTQVKEKVHVEANHVYVVPPNESLSMIDGFIEVSPVHTVEERRAPVDIFFRTLAESHTARAVAVVLSGTGANGSMGIKRVKERGGAAFVQNPREAEYSEMPRNSIATELIDEILNVAEIPRKIVEYGENLDKIKIPVEPANREEQQQSALREIFTQLRVRTGHDFTNYKRPTVLRRIERRINVRGLPDLPGYSAYLKENLDETNALLKDLLISVTNFFRDRKAFEFLESQIVPQILHGKKSGDAVRVWIAGCATGEEAYSLAMLLAEKIDGSLDAPAVQIFATDIDEQAIAAARSGFYSLNDAADVSPERLHRFFIKEKDGFRIRRELREMTLFAAHNLLKDPPFSQLDLVTCRNLLIYFNGTAQERALETFHFSLKSGGFLFLGSSESIDGADDLYQPISHELRIFQARRASPRIAYPVPDLSPSFVFRQPVNVLNPKIENRPREQVSYGDLHQEILEQYAPPSLIINEQFDIVHVSERAGRYLQVSGELSHNLFKLIRPELRLKLSTAVHQAVQRQTNVAAENLIVRTDENRTESVNVNVRPVLRGTDDAMRGFILIIFEQTSDAPEASEAIFESNEPAMRQLEEALLQSQTQYRVSIERSEIQAEELKASNEELQAINEELRSTTEELETGKEELQSVNEELLTVNQELKIKIEELSQSVNDFQNLMNSTHIGTTFLDRNFRVKMFTPAAQEIFNFIPSDIGRDFSDITHKLENENLNAEVETVLNQLQPVEREVRTTGGTCYLMQITPYRTTEDSISGTIITFVNITSRKQAEENLREAVKNLEQQTRIFDTTLSNITDFAYIFDREGRFVYANRPLLDLLGITAEEIKGKNFHELNYPPDLAARLQSQIQQVSETGEIVRDETPFTNPAGEMGFYEYIFSPVKSTGGAVEFIAGSTRDVTERKQSEAKLRESEERLRIAVEAAEMGTWDWNLKTNEVFWNERHFTLFGMKPHLNGIKPEDFFDHVHEDDRETVSKRLKESIEKQTVFEAEFRVRLDTGGIRWMEGYGKAVETSGDEIIRMCGVMSDITIRKRSEKRIRESEERLSLIIKSVEDYAIITTDTECTINGWNPGAEKMFGYTEKEIVGQSCEIIFTPEDRKKGIPAKEMQAAIEKGSADDERFHLRKDGTRFYVSGVMQPIKDGKIDGFVKIARDMTEKIAAEQNRRDKEMLQKLVGAQEDERRRIARDLHDELGQLLTALRLKLEAVRKLSEDNKELCAKVDDVQTVAKHLDAGIDFLAWELRPAALDDLGLRAALEKYVREWSHFSGVTAELIGTGIKKARLAAETETNVYRIAQEALNNVHKHAKAKNVEIALDKRGDLVVLIIADDGVGFDTEDKLNRRKGIGLIGMKERAALIGGSFEIESAPGEGTTLYVRVPASFIERKKSNEK